MDSPNLQNRFDFYKNFLGFRFYKTEKKGIKNLSSYSGKSYTTVVFGDSEVSLFGDGEDATFFSISLLCFIYIKI